MNVLVTGATGFIGHHVARLLCEKGFSVRALVRQGSDAAALRDLGVHVIYGDLRDIGSLTAAIMDCKHVYHIAADYRLWVPDPKSMYEINVQGTRNILEAALRHSVEKFVYTSTVGVLASSADKRPSHEGSVTSFDDMVGHYKKSKFLAEREAYFFLDRGLPVVIVSPSTPIGTRDRKPTPTGKMIVDFLNGKIPAYVDTGLNFVDVEDVAAGHLLAAEKGQIGQKYILGGLNMSLREFFDCLARVSGEKPPKIRLPYLPILVAAHIDEAFSKWVTKKQPRIPLTGVKMARKYMYFDSSKAIRELRFPQSAIEGAIEKSICWFRDHGYVRGRT